MFCGRVQEDDLLQLLQAKPVVHFSPLRDRKSSSPESSPRAASIPPLIKLFINSLRLGILGEFLIKYPVDARVRFRSLLFCKYSHQLPFRVQYNHTT